MSRRSEADGAVSYEVTVTLTDPAQADRFTSWMLNHHITAVLATDCFLGADFGRLDARTFRTCYRAAGRAELDRYLAQHTSALRADFEREFGAVAGTARQVWTVLADLEPAPAD